MNIAFDIDGVFTDFEWFMDVYGKRFFRVTSAKAKKSTSVAERFGYDRKYDKHFYLLYLVWYAKHFPIRENVAETTRRLKKQGHKIYIVTARALTDKDNAVGKYMQKLLEQWLAKNGVQYDEIHFCNTENSADEKVKWCQRLHIDVFVEDDPKNIQALQKHCRVVCVSADYNQELENVEYAVDFNEVYCKLCGEMDGFRPVSLETRVQYSKEERVRYCERLRKYHQDMPFDEKRHNEYVDKYLDQVRKYHKLALKLFRIRLEGNQPLNTNAIYVCNHTSLLDVPMCYCALYKVFARVLTKRELEAGCFGGYLRSMGFVFLDRGNKKSGKIVRNTMIQTLLNGGSVCLFPEGRRNKEKKGLLPFKIGAVYMAQVTGRPIVPFVINEVGKEHRIVVLDEFWVRAEDDLKAKNDELREKMLGALRE